MVTVSVSVQPLASVAVTIYVPAARPLAVAPEAPLDQVYVTTPVPPDDEAVAEPLEPPKQLTGVGAAIAATSAAGCEIVVVAVVLQLFASVTVTV